MPSTLPKVELPVPPPQPNTVEARTTSVDRERQALQHGFTQPKPKEIKNQNKIKKKIKNEIKKPTTPLEDKVKTNIRLPASRVAAADELTRHLQQSLKQRYPGRPLRWRKEDTHDLALQLLLALPEDEALGKADEYLKTLYSL